MRYEKDFDRRVQDHRPHETGLFYQVVQNPTSDYIRSTLVLEPTDDGFAWTRQEGSRFDSLEDAKDVAHKVRAFANGPVVVINSYGYVVVN